MIKFIQNIGDFFSSNYFDDDFHKKVFEKSAYAKEDREIFNKKITELKPRFYELKREFLEGRLRTKDKVTATHKFHNRVLKALGYEGDRPEYNDLFHTDEKNVLPIRHILYRGEQPHLMIMEMHALIKEGEEEPDGLFEQRYNVEDEELQTPPQKYHRSQWSNVFKVPEGVSISPMVINKAVSQLFLLPARHRPKFILLCAGNQYFLLEQEKWFKGSYLKLDLEELFDSAKAGKRDHLSLFYFLLSKETLAPKSEIVLMDQLDEDSHKSAYEVTKDLKEGVIFAVETLANEAVKYLTENGKSINDIEAGLLKDDCLNMVYRLLFLFYAESRNDLDILPSGDEVYQQGYSMEMLRNLEQEPLQSASAQNGFFFHDSLYQLFRLLSSGYNESIKETESFRIRHLDSPLFDDRKLNYLADVKIRNITWRDIICKLSLSKKKKGRARGRISYANLGINQLGSVYESLLAFRGFFAESDYIEVHRKKKKKETSAQVAAKDGSYLVPRHRLSSFEPDEIYYENNEELKVIHKGTFIYRLNGRDRQNSASYYTPEVLTECTVKYTLKPILERLDKKEMKALELLDLKILEPAMGAAAFHNEVINQLAEAYLMYRQEEMNKKVAPDKYREELQKVKAYIALNNVYGVDLNPTAVELGKLSLWLNVLHRDMQTPFFGYRLGVGNAVVGAWLKVYTEADFILEFPKKSKRPIKKEWWNSAPKHLKYKKQKLNRKDNEIYHFLLPDKNMVASAGIKMLKKEFPTEAKRVTDWRKEFCKPIEKDEYLILKSLSKEIDKLLEDHYQFQRQVDRYAMIKGDFFGAYDEAEQFEITHVSYKEKEELAAKRLSGDAPYAKLKMVMDYWCSLWFWDVRDAVMLPTRREWLQDLVALLNVDMSAAHVELRADWIGKNGEQGALFETPGQMSLGTYRKEEETEYTVQKIAGLKEKTDLFEQSDRLKKVADHARRYRFFHYQLEFIEVFKERSGFDVIVGNPPWVKLQFDEAGIISEAFPEVMIRKDSSSKVRKKLLSYFAQRSDLKNTYLFDYVAIESTATFLNATQNFPLLKGQQTNLYKCIIENGFVLTAPQGMMGLVHPESIYDDPKGQLLRKAIYQRLKYHFQFVNVLHLFKEILHWVTYGINVYSGKEEEIEFISINNLFHPATIKSSIIHDGNGSAGGIKQKVEKGNGEISFEWNISPHRDRVIKIQARELMILAKTFEDSDEWQTAKLVSVHAQQIISVLKKLSLFPSKVGDFKSMTSEGWHETNAQDKGIIQRQTQYPTIDDFEMIYSGPHFYVGNPFYKCPLTVCSKHHDYDVIDLIDINENYIARTNYIPAENLTDFENRINGLKILEYDVNSKPIYDNWIDYYKIVWSKMLSQSGERTLQSALVYPKISHIDGCNSIIFSDEKRLIEFLGLTMSIPLDFFIKTTGKATLRGNIVNFLPLGIAPKYYEKIANRTLLLNCLTNPYSALWKRHYSATFTADDWSLSDNRLKDLSSLTAVWTWDIPLRNSFERRQALIEIDVLSAMALGLNLEELKLIYEVQFPVLQQNEIDTWYDQKGNIVFTCSKGLTGVGLDRGDWNLIKDMKSGEYKHTIEKSELYRGKEVIYYAPFEKCDRVEDYKTAWAHFEQIFKTEK